MLGARSLFQRIHHLKVSSLVKEKIRQIFRWKYSENGNSVAQHPIKSRFVAVPTQLAVGTATCLDENLKSGYRQLAIDIYVDGKSNGLSFGRLSVFNFIQPTLGPPLVGCLFVRAPKAGVTPSFPVVPLRAHIA